MPFQGLIVIKPAVMSKEGINPIHNLIVIIAVEGWSMPPNIVEQLVEDLYPAKDKSNPST